MKRTAVFEEVQPNPSWRRDYNSGSDYGDDDGFLRPRKKERVSKNVDETLELNCDWIDCGEVYRDYDYFQRHLVQHVEEDGSEHTTCPWEDCNWEITSSQDLLQHICYHGYITKLIGFGNQICAGEALPECFYTCNEEIPLNPEGFDCEWDDCPEKSKTIDQFIIHVKMHVNGNPSKATDSEEIRCLWKDCHNNFSTRGKLNEHCRVHTKERMVACPSCFKLFTNKTKFLDHRKRQLSSELQFFKCAHCLKHFSSERLLTDHMRVHVNHYKCNMCDMTCPKPSILARHIRYKHLNDKFFQCTLCDKKFVQKQNLTIHLKSHSQKKDYGCQFCTDRFMTQYGRNIHLEKVHDQKLESTYECHCCKQLFKRGSFLTKHLMSVHNYQWPSGHSRFRYLRQEDGLHRLQTIRYESLEVSQEIQSHKNSTPQQNFEPMSEINIIVRGSAKNLAPINLEGSKSDEEEDDDEEDEEDDVEIVETENVTVEIDDEEQESKEQVKKEEGSNKDVLITFDDVDNDGNIVNSKVIQPNTSLSSILKTKSE